MKRTKEWEGTSALIVLFEAPTLAPRAKIPVKVLSLRPPNIITSAAYRVSRVMKEKLERGG